MSVAFWSVKLTNGKAVEVQPPEGYVLNVMQAAYSGNDHAVIKVHTTSVEGDKLESIIGTLRAKTNEQFTLDLVFGYDVPVAFSVEGKGEVYLNGYYQPGPEEEDENDYDDEFGSEEDSEEGSEDDEDEEGSEDDDEEQNIKNAEAAIAKLGASRSKDLAVTGKKISKAQQQSDSEEEGSEDDDEDSEGDSEDERIDQDFVAKMIKRHGLANGKAPKSSRVEELGSDEEEDSEDEEGSEDDEDEEESEEESEEEQPPMKVQKTQPKGVVTQAGNKQQQGKPNTPGKPQHQGGSKPNTPANKPQNNNQGQNKTPSGKPQQNGNKTPNTNNKQQNSGFKSGDKRKR